MTLKNACSKPQSTLPPDLGHMLIQLMEPEPAAPHETHSRDISWRAELARFLEAVEGELAEHPSRSLFDELRAVEPAMEGRFRQLEAEQARLQTELRELRARLDHERAFSRSMERSWRSLSRRLRTIKQGEVRALFDAYMMDLGGEA